MRIGIDVTQAMYEGSGVAQYTKSLVESLLKLDSRNIYVLFAFTWGGRKFLRSWFETLEKNHKNVEHVLLPFPEKIANLFWNRIHAIPVEMAGVHIDIYHSSDWFEPPSRAKKITTVHDLIVYKYPETSHPYIIDTHKRRLEWVKKESDRVIADSESTKQDLVHILSFDPNRIDVVHAGLGEEFRIVKDEEVERVRKKYSLYDTYMLTVGTQEPRKNLKRVAEGFQMFRDHPLSEAKKTPIELVVVGKIGWGASLGSPRFVKPLGFVPKEDLPALFAGASVFIYASLYEGFGLPILEAMACGCPVICSERGSLAEISGDASIHVDPTSSEDIAKKMMQVSIDRELRENLIKNGKANAKKFSWRKTSKQVLSIYESLVQ